MKKKIVKINKIIVFLILFIILLLKVVNAESLNNEYNFKVIFIGNPRVSNSDKVTATVIDDTNATMNLIGFEKEGDKEIIEYTLQNASLELAANLSIKTKNSNSEYFSVKSELEKTQLKNGEVAVLKVIVELIKAPITESVSTKIEIQLEAEPLQSIIQSEENNSNFEKPSTIVEEFVDEMKNFIPNTGDGIIVYIIMLIVLIIVLIIITIMKKIIKFKDKN